MLILKKRSLRGRCSETGQFGLDCKEHHPSPVNVLSKPDIENEMYNDWYCDVDSDWEGA